MADEAKNAPVVEAKETKPVTEAGAENKPAAKTEETIGEALKPKEQNTEAKMVPEAALLEYKNQAKSAAKEARAATRALEELKASIESGASKSEVKKSLKEIADEHNVDEKFLQDFAAAVKAQAEADVEERVSSKLKPLEDKENATRVDKIFDEHYAKTLEAMPEYKDIANKEVIKTLALDPRNANKTFAKILEESYGHLIQGKKTLETTKVGGGKEDAEIDYARARRDSEYFKELMSDPHTKAKYNDGLAQRLKL